MPKGQYVRKKRKATDNAGEQAPPPLPKKRRRAAVTRAPAKRNGGPPRFGVFDDGSVAIELPNCKGRLTGEEARVLVEFVQRLGARI